MMIHRSARFPMLLLFSATLAVTGGCAMQRHADNDAAAVPVAVVNTAPARARPAAPAVRPTTPWARGGAGTTVETVGGYAAIPLRADAPDRYVVKRGDTLWDISGLFLRDPWMWPEIWYVNPQIDNPHLIYPGDILSLVWVDGRPQLQLQRAGTGRDRLSPQIRIESLQDAVAAVPYDAIASFLSKPTILDKATIRNAPYMVDIRESHLIAGSGFHVWVRGTDAPIGTRFQVYHIGEPLYDPDNGELLGQDGIYVGEGRITQMGDPAEMFLTETVREALIGDRLILEEPQLPLNFYPHPPGTPIEGRIISVIDGVSLIGTYQIVALNVGAVDGIAPGHVLSVWQTGEVITDRVASAGGLRGLFQRKVRLPDQHAGELMIFRVLDQMSYGLIMRATSEIAVLDTVRNPR